MPPSQLKQLKASLRDHGLVGPQKSKKQKKAASKDGNQRLHRNAALQNIRERFNPFEVKATARKDKFDVASNKVVKSSPGRPGVTKGLGEERRKATLLKEIQLRNKVGGLLDRRFGENDPTITPEQKAAERFARQSQRKTRKSSMFNLEDEDEGGVELTHHGISLFLSDENGGDDFQEDIGGLSDDSESDLGDYIDDRPTKRVRMSEADNVDDGADEDAMDQFPERKKSKQEVMKEVIAKSKLYKYERQQAKEDDDDLRAELDRGMSEFYDALRSHNSVPKVLPTPPSTDTEPMMNPDRAAMLAGKDREIVEKEYNRRMNEMKLDQRAKPAERVKSQDEKAAEEAERLQELERKRVRRMKGDVESSDEDEPAPVIGEGDEPDDAGVFGLGQATTVPILPELDVEDEDEFVIDDDLIASSDADVEGDFEGDSDDEDSAQDDGDDDFINGLVLPDTDASGSKDKTDTSVQRGDRIAYTYPCPKTHQELLKITKGTKVNDLPTIVQRIRALHHQGLAEGNKLKLAKFASVLTEHVAYLADEGLTPLTVLESLLRHLHSMAKSQPESVGTAFRERLRQIAEDRPLALTRGDLIILTGISTIFPTSDHFHPVVTPAKLTIARYLGQSDVQSLNDLGIGAFCCTLALQYERLSKRYVPEVIKYLTNALAMLAPVPIPASVTNDAKWTIPIRLPTTSLAIKTLSANDPSKFGFNDLFSTRGDSELLQVCLLSTLVKLLSNTAQLWTSKTAFPEIIDSPILAIAHLLTPLSLPHLNSSLISLLKSSLATLTNLRDTSVANRKPLLLHSHRPLAIKGAIPKFEEGFNPDRHYDPDQDRAQLNKLKAEHKRERKGAMRELRKDANFIARESLREKKEKDEAYERKFKRLVAEIQGEEGREAKNYEKERLKRKGRW
jgi:nucleolar protein 14